MSVNIGSIQQFPFSGTPFTQAVNLDQQRSQATSVVPLLFNWNDYYTKSGGLAQLGVAINLAGGSTPLAGALDKIRGIKIDNSNSNLFISVFFPDTGDLIACSPDCVQYAPVMTNGQTCVVIAQGLNALNAIASSKIYLTNFFLPVSSDYQKQLTFPQWLGSPSIQRGSNSIITPGFAPPALGDQTAQYFMPGTAAPQTIGILGSPKPSGYYYLTGVYANFINGSPGNSVATWKITGAVSGDLYTFQYGGAYDTQIGPCVLYNQTGLQLRLDATDTWTWTGNSNAAPGFLGSNSICTLILNYAYNQN